MRLKSFLDKKEQNRSCKNKVFCKEAIVCKVNDRLPTKSKQWLLFWDITGLKLQSYIAYLIFM